MCFTNEQLDELFNQHPEVKHLLAKAIEADVIGECAGAVFDYGPEDFNIKTFLEVIEFEACTPLPEGHRRFVSPETYYQIVQYFNTQT